MTTRILVGDARDILPTLPERSVHCVVTSPPYLGLRDYGTAQWDGGDAGCDHKPPHRPFGERRTSTLDGSVGIISVQEQGTNAYRDTCGKCGAVRVDRQIGLEGSLEAYITTLVAVFRSVWRVLRDDGTCWLNLGDSYANGSSGGDTKSGFNGRYFGKDFASDKQSATAEQRPIRRDSGIKPKDLMMVPARVALALQADGWYLRSDIIWAKRAPMPESVTDRPTSAHEHVFLLTKKPRYFYDAEAVKEENSSPEQLAHNLKYAKTYDAYDGRAATTGQPGNVNNVGIHSRPGLNGRNLRNVWHLGPEPFAAAHFAVYPTEIPRRAILAGTSERGCCPACGAPWKRVTERSTAIPARNGAWKSTGENHRNDIERKGGFYDQASQTLGWHPSCSCNAGPPIPCTVMDIFGGSGTTSLVADRLGRDSIYIDLSAEYAAMAKQRIYEDAPLFAEVTTT